MSYRMGHQPLTLNGYAWLSAAADPNGKDALPGPPIPPGELALLIEAAAAHGVLPAVARNLRRCCVDFGASAIVSDVDAEQRIANAFRELDSRLVLLTGQSLLLSHHAQRIAKALAAEDLAAAIIKGPVFSRRLYPRPADRSFTDIDILVSSASLEATAEILRRLGFAPAPSENRSGHDHGEYKWLLPGNDLILVEVQSNLIHSARLGNGIRFGFADLSAAGDGNTEDATALLILAAVHGAATHQFERLQPAIDVLQAARGAAGPINRVRLARIADMIGATAALQTALDIAAQLFQESEAREIADSLSPAPWRRLRRGLLSPAVVIRAQARSAGLDSWRRRAVREIIRSVGKPIPRKNSV